MSKREVEFTLVFPKAFVAPVKKGEEMEVQETTDWLIEEMDCLVEFTFPLAKRLRNNET